MRSWRLSSTPPSNACEPSRNRPAVLLTCRPSGTSAQRRGRQSGSYDAGWKTRQVVANSGLPETATIGDLALIRNDHKEQIAALLSIGEPEVRGPAGGGTITVAGYLDLNLTIRFTYYIILPIHARRHWMHAALVRTPSGLLAVRSRGRTANPAIVLLHSLGSSSLAFEPVLRLLEDRYSLFAVDAWGHGDSPARDTPFSLEGTAADVAALIDGASRPITCVGVSMGGLIAQLVAARWPDLVSRLVLANTFQHLADGPARVQEFIGQLARKTEPSWLDLRASRALSATAPLESRQLYMRAADAVDLSSYVAAAESVYRADTRELGPRIGCPTLILTGDSEQRIPVAATMDLARAIRGAQLVSLRHAGHLSHLDVPMAFADILDKFAAGKTLSASSPDYELITTSPSERTPYPAADIMGRSDD